MESLTCVREQNTVLTFTLKKSHQAAVIYSDFLKADLYTLTSKQRRLCCFGKGWLYGFGRKMQFGEAHGRFSWSSCCLFFTETLLLSPNLTMWYSRHLCIFSEGKEAPQELGCMINVYLYLCYSGGNYAWSVNELSFPMSLTGSKPRRPSLCDTPL